ncbi:MAG: hypothetical protein IJM23_00900 [Lachnospiraceae bacterium]|nr:hypothetical protein [Lachnospiraceae bacterium]
MKDFITVDLKDLLYRIILKWRLMIIFAVIFAVAANMFGIYKSKKSADAMAADQAALSEDAESIKALLTDKEAQEVDIAVSAYMNFKKRCDALSRYLDGSVFASLDFSAVPTVKVNYIVDSHYETEYPVIEKKNFDSELAGMYIQKLSGGYDETAEKYGLDTGFIDELITFDHEEGSALFTAVIYGRDRQMCEDIAAALDGRVNSASPEIASALVPHDVIRVSSEYMVAPAPLMRTTQGSYVYELNNYRGAMMTVVNTLNADQKSALEAYVKAAEKSDESEETAADTAATSSVSVSFIHKKLILAGFIFGIILVCGFVCLSYVHRPVVRVKESITGAYKKSVLGTVWEESKDKKKNPIDKWLTSLFYGRESEFGYDKRLDMLSAGIAVAMSKEGLESLYITGACDKGEKLIKDLVKRLSSKVKVSSGESVLYSPKSLADMSESQAVVFVETVGDSRYDEISREIELAESSKVKIMGFILRQE